MSSRFHTLRFHSLVVTGALALTTLVAAPVLAQQAPPSPPAQGSPPGPPGHPDGEPPKPIEPPANLPHPQHGDTRPNLDKLFEALKVAPNDESAKFVENRIWAIWLANGGDTGTLLMSRVKTAMDTKDLDLALKLLNAIVDIRPDYVEAWNRRATVHYMKKDFGSALDDIHEVLIREPRHFGALSGLGMILQEVGDDKHALEAFRRALAVHPRLERIPDLVKKLTDTVEGRSL